MSGQTARSSAPTSIPRVGLVEGRVNVWRQTELLVAPVMKGSSVMAVSTTALETEQEGPVLLKAVAKYLVTGHSVSATMDSSGTTVTSSAHGILIQRKYAQAMAIVSQGPTAPRPTVSVHQDTPAAAATQGAPPVKTTSLARVTVPVR